MARGGYRPGAGRPKKSGGPSKKELAEEAVREATSAGMTPLEYMLSVSAIFDAPKRLLQA